MLDYNPRSLAMGRSGSEELSLHTHTHTHTHTQGTCLTTHIHVAHPLTQSSGGWCVDDNILELRYSYKGNTAEEEEEASISISCKLSVDLPEDFSYGRLLESLLSNKQVEEEGIEGLREREEGIERER